MNTACNVELKPSPLPGSKWLGTSVLIVLLSVILVSCDPGMSPGMTIHQEEGASARTRDSADPCSIDLHVEETRKHIGSTWYDPELVVTNAGEGQIRISRVELVANGTTYNLDQRYGEKVARLIPANSVKRLQLGFDLAQNPVSKVFEKSAFIQIAYTADDIPKSCTLEIVGSP